MDYVVANPPYVRIHNLQENFDIVRNYEFAQSGMTDLFIVFYELGFKMLNANGKLVCITPSSFYSSVAGKTLSNKNFTRDNYTVDEVFVSSIGLALLFSNIKPIKEKYYPPKLQTIKKTQRNINAITENYKGKIFDSFDIANLLKISPSGAYKFLVRMVDMGILTCGNGDYNKLVFRFI
jgi:hypothetical protein